jgi:MOSC domain-containing protein YiiM
VQPILAQLNTSPGGIPKLPVLFARVTRDGVDGDRQRNRKYHGGPDRAVCIYSEELYADLRDAGVDLVNGAVGENFTTRGLNLQALAKGDRLRVGAECVIEITDVRVPCRTLAKWSPDLPWMIEGRSGWVAKVVSEGTVRPGDPIEVLPRETPATFTKEKAGAA